MNCRKVKALLVPFLEGDLPGKQREKIESHLELCTHCQRERELLHQSWQMLDNYVAPKLKDDFTPSLMRRIRSEQTKTERVTYGFPRFILRPLVPVFTVFLIAVLTFLLFWKEPILKDKSDKPMMENKLAKPIPSESGNMVTLVSDEEIIKNLDILENIDLLENVKLLNELDVAENLKG
ncbi:MAG: zf-HC2 domain-containing protein [Nitrospirae bacterium]|nr:zf-HC2 domain-containing protein [Nitrospirota bacterium]